MYFVRRNNASLSEKLEMKKDELNNEIENNEMDKDFENYVFRLKIGFAALSLASILSLGMSLHRSSNKDEKKEVKVPEGYNDYYSPICYDLYCDENGFVYAKKSESEEIKVQ